MICGLLLHYLFQLKLLGLILGIFCLETAMKQYMSSHTYRSVNNYIVFVNAQHSIHDNVKVNCQLQTQRNN